METKFTPGPWKLNERDWTVSIPVRPGGAWASAYGGSDANARLIAAAPELYEALRTLSDNVIEAWPDLARLRPLRDAQAALAKARGEPQSQGDA